MAMKCNQQQKCNECKKNFWLGGLNQMENYPEKGIFCDNCLNKIEKKCRRCDKLFVDRELTAKEAKKEEEWKRMLKEEYGKEPENSNLSLQFCHGGAPCHIKVNKNCHGHRIKQCGIFCSSECSNDWYEIISKDSKKFKEWKKVAEERGWQRCQEKNILHRNPQLEKWLLEDLKWDRKKLACWGYARVGEKYCENCKEEHGEGQKVKENSWQEDYRKYWNLTDENTYLTNRKDDLENNLMESSSDNDSQNKIKEKERQLEKLVKEDNSSSKIEELKREIQELKNQQKDNSATENSTKNKVITYSVIGFLLLALIGFTIVLTKPKRKNPKIK